MQCVVKQDMTVLITDFSNFLSLRPFTLAQSATTKLIFGYMGYIEALQTYIRPQCKSREVI